MPVGFTAVEFNVIEEDGTLITALGGHSSAGDDLYLMLQHQYEHDGQDRELGFDQPYIEYCGQGWSWYGHIVHFRLRRSRIQVVMDQAAAARMGNDGEIEVTFDLSDEQFQALRTALSTTFADQTCYQVSNRADG
jgi:hypothetical protein